MIKLRKIRRNITKKPDSDEIGALFLQLEQKRNPLLSVFVCDEVLGLQTLVLFLHFRRDNGVQVISTR